MNPFENTPYTPPPAGFQEGTLVVWEDKKGFGWIELHGRRVFVHAKAFDRGQRRPEAGERVKFIQAADAKGRPCAKAVRFVREGPAGRIGVAGWVMFCVLMFLPVAALRQLPVPLWITLLWVLVVSWITSALYGYDKKRAQAGSWRVPESWLHFWELLGGWPAAWLSQRRLRHKTAKLSYQFTFWVIVLIHQVAALDFLTGGKVSGPLIALALGALHDAGVMLPSGGKL